MRVRRTSGWFVAAVLAAVATTTVTTVAIGPVSATPPPDPGTGEGDRGSWLVTSLGGDQYDARWTSPTRLPMTSDRPTVVGPDDVVVAVPTVEADARTVHAQITSATAPDPDELDVVLSGDRLDVGGDDLARAVPGEPHKGLRLPGTETLPVDPGTPGPYVVAASDYHLAPVKLAGMPKPVEMVGHVVEPAAGAETGPRPLVLFLHGRHSVCYDPHDNGADGAERDWPCRPPLREIPSQLGYDYLQRVLASQGYATVSVRVNGINAQDFSLADGGAGARAQIVQRHLDHWVRLAPAHRVDLSRVVLIGHSRGGEGVDRASIQIPLSAPYRIVGQVLVAPTDFASQTAPYVPTVTLLPFCDGDVSDLQGQRFTDTARDLTTDDTSLKSSVLVMGANHNYFNTEWTPGLAKAPAWDDWVGKARADCGSRNADRLTPKEQQHVGTAYVAGAVHLFADDEQDLLPLFDGSRARVASMGGAVALSHAIGGGRTLRKPGPPTARTLPRGASTRFCGGFAGSGRVASCSHGIGYGPVKPHWPDVFERVPTRPFFEMSWTAAGQSGGMLLNRSLDLTTGRLELRTIVDPARGAADLRVRITDRDGSSALLTPSGGGVLPALGSRGDTRRLWAQTLVADPSAAAGDMDLGHVARVDLVSGSTRGRVWVADLGVAPSTLAPVPDRRIPTVDLGRARVTEGNRRANVMAYVPFHVVGDLTQPARFLVTTSGQEASQRQRFTVDLAPGQRSGRIPVSYRSDVIDDLPRTVTPVGAWAMRNVMTDAYQGAFTVVDDDRTPRMTVEPAAATVTEGRPARWVVTLARRVDYDLFVQARVVRGPGSPLTGADVPARWLRDRYGKADRRKPLWALRLSLFGDVRPGRRGLVLTIPTRRDGIREGRESVTLKVRLGSRTFTRAVRVAPS